MRQLPCLIWPAILGSAASIRSHIRRIPVPKHPTTIGGHLRRRRLQLKIYQPEAARLLRVSTVTLSRWECDKVAPTPPYYPGIASYLGFDPFAQTVSKT